MEISWKEQNRFLLVNITGEIDHHTAEEIRTKVDKAFARAGAKHIVFDMSRVGFMDSSGIGVLIGRYRAIEALGGKVFTVGIGDDLRRIFDISGLPKIIGCYADAEAAIKSVEGNKGGSENHA